MQDMKLDAVAECMRANELRESVECAFDLNIVVNIIRAGYSNQCCIGEFLFAV